MGAGSSKDNTTTNASTTSKSRYSSRHEDWPWVWAIREGCCLDWKSGLSNEEILLQSLRMQDLPVPITDRVLLGNAASVQDVEILRRKGVTAVLNLAGPTATPPETVRAYERAGITYRCVEGAEDEVDYPMLENHWEEASEFLRETTTTSTKTTNAAGDGPGRCVVHCAGGVNRSVLVVAYHVMSTTRTPVLEVVAHLRARRGNVALQNEGFQEQLVAAARTLGLLGAAPGTEGSRVRQTPIVPPSRDWTVSLREPKRLCVDALDRLVRD